MRARPAWIIGALAAIVVVGVFVAIVLPRLTSHPSSSFMEPDPYWASPAASPPAVAVSASPGPVPAGGIATLVDPSWASATAAATGIPERAVLAYAGAALTKAATTPACRLSWTTLAAIGDVESGNGRHGGSTIQADGTVSPPIYGVALNGKGVALIPDSDDGAIDGDADADRAVGPMQLIPQTWRNWHADGNGDGTDDPQNIDDAAVATSNYLCRASSALDTAEGWRRAIAAYNSAGSYLGKVAAVATRYNADAARVGR